MLPTAEGLGWMASSSTLEAWLKLFRQTKSWGIDSDFEAGLQGVTSVVGRTMCIL